MILRILLLERLSLTGYLISRGIGGSSMLGPITTPLSLQSTRYALGGTWMEKKYYPKASEILITADCGGSNSYRSRLWKRELQKFASESGLTVRVCHFPPGTSKWNTIEHSIFSFISMNWRGQPLESIETVINLIANTKTKQGLSIKPLLMKGNMRKG